MINEIIRNIKVTKNSKVPVPNIFTEFGSFTVGESMAHIYSIMAEKRQNDRETWYMIDSPSSPLPDTWGIGEKFLMLPINKWANDYQQVVLGGITCDSHDYYDSEEHINEVFLPKLDEGALLPGVLSYRRLPGPDQRVTGNQTLPDPLTEACDHWLR